MNAALDLYWPVMEVVAVVSNSGCMHFVVGDKPRSSVSSSYAIH